MFAEEESGSGASAATRDSTEVATINAYVLAWSKDDYKGMHGLLSQEAKKFMPLAKFKQLLEEQRTVHGGVKEIADLKKIRGDDAEAVYELKILYRKASARSINIKTTLAYESDLWKIASGGLIPMDESEYDN